MRMLLGMILVVATVTAAAAEYPYPLGPCSRLAKYPEGALWNGFCGVQVERGFKLQALARYRSPQEAQEHLAQVDDRPTSHEFFDFTEAYALLAYPWLAAMGVR